MRNPQKQWRSNARGIGRVASERETLREDVDGFREALDQEHFHVNECECVQHHERVDPRPGSWRVTEVALRNEAGFSVCVPNLA